MMIDEAIKHCEEVAKEKESEAEDLEYSKLDWKYEANQCSECAKEHRQLAEWLKELKAYRENTCEDCISRAYIGPIIEELENICVNGDEHVLDLLADIKNAPSVTSHILADALMEERIRGKLNSDTIFEKDVIPDVKCILTVSIRDRRPCYCGAGLREVWRESEE